MCVFPVMKIKWTRMVFGIYTVILILQFPSCKGQGQVQYSVEELYQETDLSPENHERFFFSNQMICESYDVADSYITHQKTRTWMPWAWYLHPYFVRNSRLKTQDGNLKHVKHPIEPLIERRSESLFMLLIFMFPFFTLIPIIVLFTLAPLATCVVIKFGQLITSDSIRECIRARVIKMEMKRGELQIYVTPSGARLDRYYSLFFLWRRDVYDEYPEELREFNRNLLVSHRRIVIDPPMMVKYSYYFEKRNLWLDPVTNMVAHRPEPDHVTRTGFDELEMLQSEEAYLDSKIGQVAAERLKYTEARRKVYNIAASRMYAIQQGVPYLHDASRSKIMVKVEKARREKKQREARAKGLPDPYRHVRQSEAGLLADAKHERRKSIKRVFEGMAEEKKEAERLKEEKWKKEMKEMEQKKLQEKEEEQGIVIPYINNMNEDLDVPEEDLEMPKSKRVRHPYGAPPRMPEDAPNAPVRKRTHSSPQKFNPYKPGGGIVTDYIRRKRNRKYLRDLAKKPKTEGPNMEDLRAVRKQILADAARIENEQAERDRVAAEKLVEWRRKRAELNLYKSSEVIDELILN